jgi:hypothetical protein
MADKKDVRNLIAKRNPLERPKIQPVDLYQVPTEAPPQPAPESQPQEASVPSVESAPKDEDTVKPYSTYLRASLIEGIKLRAFKQHVKDRPIVGAALEDYFQNHPLD